MSTSIVMATEALSFLHVKKVERGRLLDLHLWYIKHVFCYHIFSSIYQSINSSKHTSIHSYIHSWGESEKCIDGGGGYSWMWGTSHSHEGSFCNHHTNSRTQFMRWRRKDLVTNEPVLQLHPLLQPGMLSPCERQREHTKLIENVPGTPRAQWERRIMRTVSLEQRNEGRN